MRFRSVGALVLVCSMVLGLGANSASAAEVPDTRDAPPESEVATEDGGMGIAAAGPATSPGPERLYYRDSRDVSSCPRGYFCASVWDSSRGKYAIFQFYTCTVRRLYRWENGGNYYNNQTGGAVTSFRNYFGTTIKRIPAGGKGSGYDWDPVWHIDPC